MSAVTNDAGDPVPQWWIDKGADANDWDAGFKAKKLKSAPGGKYGKKH